MLLTRLKRFGRIIVFVAVIIALVASLASLNSNGTTVSAASLKHIDDIVAQGGTFNILELVPDTAAASIGYYIDGQEPIASWKTTVAGKASPSERSKYVNDLFSRLASTAPPDKSVLSKGTATPLKLTYYDDVNSSYYTESYLVSDPQNWSRLHLNAPESVTVTGTMTAAQNGAFRASYSYAVQNGSGYIQNIAYFSYTASPIYGNGTYFYTPTFTKIQAHQDLTGWENVAVYTKDASGNYVVNPSKIFVKDYLSQGGLDNGEQYYYVKPAETGAPGNNKYAAVVSKSDADDAPGDGFTAPAQGGGSYFSRSISGYTYVGTGGNYTYSSTGGASYKVTYNDIFYKAGFVNNNLFKTLVFGLDSTTMNSLGMTVTTKKASDVTAADISNAGLIYLSSGTDITQAGVTMSYSASNDIPDARAVDIYNYAAGLNPVIVDYPLVSGLTRSTSPSARNMQKLSLLCLQSGLSLPVTSLSALTSANWDTIWSNLAYVTVSSESDKTFVNNNVYCFNAFNYQTLGSAANIIYLASPRFDSSFSADVYGNGFAAVLAEIQNENFLRTLAHRQDLMQERVTVANSVRHIINYKGRRQGNQKTAITVLDLEPAKVTSATWLTTDTVRGWINNALPANQITIVHMTTGEFVGKIADLNETYDMIYIGMSTEGMNTTGSGSTVSTVYNDTSMNGLIYTNIGDRYYALNEMAGIRSQDYVQNALYNGKKPVNYTYGTTADTFRFSGNDITDSAVTSIRKFVAAGYPIILADGFVSGSGINTAKVDDSSYMYQAVSSVYKPTNENVMLQAFAEANDTTVVKYMNVSKPSISLTAQPASYTANQNNTLTADPVDGHFYLSYTFSISNVTDSTPISTTYNCRLYIDLNADGRYTDSEELGDIVVHRASDGALMLPLKDSNNNDYYALSADVPYQVTRQMPDAYVGIIPWNLKVIKNGADQIHASQSGFTRIAAAGRPKNLKVLQIMQDGTSASKLNLSSQLTVDTSGSNPQLRGLDGKYYKGIYGKLIADLQDFKVTIDAVENDVLEAKGASVTILNYLNGYDMLIIGFNDCYDGIGPSSAAAIVSFIGSGKSVLFTHDTTSLTQVDMSGVSHYPMATNYTQPTVKQLNPTDVLHNTSTSEYRSVDGAIFWNDSYSTTAAPPYIRQDGASAYVVHITSNITSTDENAYWNAKAGTSGNFAIYQMSTGGQLTTTVTDTTTLANFRSNHAGATIIYVYTSAVGGWYGTNGNSSLFDLTTTGNFTKFVGGTRYVCSGITYNYKSSPSVTKPLNDFSNQQITDYAQNEKCIYNTTANGYTVIGKYTQSNNTYSINSATWYPATGSSFPQGTLYNKDPATLYTISNLPNQISDWGYYFNTVIRDAVGLDRYGITNPVLRSIVDVSGSLSYGDTQTVLANNRSVAFAPKNGRTATVQEVQGYTNYALIRFAIGNYSSYNIYSRVNSKNYMKNSYNNRETTMVSQVNKGQITTYPYNVNTTTYGGTDTNIVKYGGTFMQIGKTHEQYFQINMNTSDIVVWYCMANVTWNGTSTAIDDASYYDDVPNDCVNAYYIYNKGNVTYSGVGHMSDASYYTGSSIGEQYINEAKLFVNTMIAAYRSGDQAPTVRIMTDSRGTADLTSKYVAYDMQYASDSTYSPVLEESLGPTDDARAVYFRVYQPSVGNNRTVTVQYYVSTDGGTTLVPLTTGDDGGIKTYNSVGSTAGDIVDATELNGGFVYKFFLPNANCLDLLKNTNLYSARVYITATLNGSGSLTGSDYIDLKKQQLFQLT